MVVGWGFVRESFGVGVYRRTRGSHSQLQAMEDCYAVNIKMTNLKSCFPYV